MPIAHAHLKIFSIPSASTTSTPHHPCTLSWLSNLSILPLFTYTNNKRRYTLALSSEHHQTVSPQCTHSNLRPSQTFNTIYIPLTMTSYARSGPSSAVSISDLDAFSFRDYTFPTANYAPPQDDEFGFDPPEVKPTSVNMYQTYSPPNDVSMSGWPEFEREGDVKETTEPTLNLDAYEMDKFITSTLPNSETVISRFGQMTPPRSDSATSTGSKDEPLSPKSGIPRRKSSKANIKAEAPVTTMPKTAGRKRKSIRKASVESSQSGTPEDSKRKQSLEKNRLAAAKCRINKKEKTEQLQKDSHNKAIENAYLRDQIMRLKDEVQSINSILLAHANCEGCKSPEEIRAHLSAIGNDFLNQQMALSAQPDYNDLAQMNFQDLPVMSDNFFNGASQNPFVHPPLPEFDRNAEFEVHTPLQND
jgi:hypothetical protein